MTEAILKCDSCGKAKVVSLDESRDISTDDFTILSEDGWSIMGENALCPVCAMEVSLVEP